MSRIALACAGLGVVDRGFERYMRELFDAVRDQVDATLFAGDSLGAGEIGLRVPRRDGIARTLGAERAYKLELAAFAARMVPDLVRDGYALVHYVEPYLGNVLAAVRRRLGLRFRLLLTDGLGLSIRSARRADLLHVLTPLAAAEARAGRPADRLFEIPHGIHVSDFGRPSRTEARRRLGLPDDERVLLEVAALNRRHKRVDWLIEEVARLKERALLVVVGVPEEPELVALGRRKLDERFVHLRLERAQMPLAYAAADVFVHGALEEGFCLAAVEAMAAGRPVVLHRADHFRWLIEDDGQLADLGSPGSLVRALEALPADPSARNRARAAEFDWARLVPRYLEMYERALRWGAAPGI